MGYVDGKPTRKQYEMLKLVYQTMLNTSDPIKSSTADGRPIWEGNWGRDLIVANRIQTRYYTEISNYLQACEAIERLQKGGGKVKTQVVLNFDSPTDIPTTLTPGQVYVMPATKEQQMEQSRSNMQGFIETYELRLRRIEARLSQLEARLHAEGDPNGSL